jgi:hypothetical protein
MALLLPPGAMDDETIMTMSEQQFSSASEPVADRHQMLAADGGPFFDNYPPELLNAAVAMCIVFMLIGIPGNLLTIAALAKSVSAVQFFSSLSVFLRMT